MENGFRDSVLGLYLFIHERIYRETNHGVINKKTALKILRRNHNIPKDECPIIFKGLENLGLIEVEGKSYKIKKPKEKKENLILKFKKELKMV